MPISLFPWNVWGMCPGSFHDYHILLSLKSVFLLFSAEKHMRFCLLGFVLISHIIPLRLFGSSLAVGPAQIFLGLEVVDQASVSHGSFLVVGIRRGVGMGKDFSCHFQVALQSSNKYYVNIPQQSFLKRISCYVTCQGSNFNLENHLIYNFCFFLQSFP